MPATMRDVLVVLPGITGSVLQQRGIDVWAPSAAGFGNLLRTLGGSLQGLLLGADPPDVDDLGDGVSAPRIVPTVHLVPGLWKVDGYTQLLDRLQRQFTLIRGDTQTGSVGNYYEFAYDWRRDNRVAARQLQRLVDQVLPAWRRDRAGEEARVVLIAHSMGGLVARYYLEVLEGWQNCRALVTFGTPFRGSLNALNYLVNGYKQFGVDLTAVMRSFTSMYQLLPIYPVVRYNGTYHRVAELAGLPHIDPVKAQAALAFHREIEERVSQHRQEARYREAGYQVLPYVGVGQGTLQSAAWDGTNLTVAADVLPGGMDPIFGEGDGTVPRCSAIPLEMSQAFWETFVCERHAALQQHEIILRDLQGRLEQMQARGLEWLRGAEPRQAGLPPCLRLDLDDLYAAGEPVELRAALVPAPEAPVAPVAELTQANDPGWRLTRAFTPAAGGWSLRLDLLPPALYRVTVGVPGNSGSVPLPVHDLFEVV